jgi:predicted small secreted protein
MRITAFLLAAAVVFLTGCNTVHGIGRDIEKGGEAIQKVTK